MGLGGTRRLDDDEVVAASYSVSAGRFSLEGEETLFRLSQPFVLIGAAPDGRFLVALPTPGQTPTARVVLNWLQELSK